MLSALVFADRIKAFLISRTDEESGFMPDGRLSTRLLSIKVIHRISLQKTVCHYLFILYKDHWVNNRKQMEMLDFQTFKTLILYVDVSVPLSRKFAAVNLHISN